jgi:hypothetical protein
VSETPQLSGKDLARQALAAYKATARTAPANTPAKPRRKRVARRGDGRDPVSLASALEALGADLPLEAGLAGGNLLDQWPTLCPQYVGRVQAAGYDEHTGRLDLRPTSHAYAAQLRLLGGQLAKQINDKLGRPTVRSIRVLPVGAVSAEPVGIQAVASVEAPAPVKTRETASAGYRQTLAAALEHRPEPRHTDPYVAAALERQEAALRANRAPEAVEPEPLAERRVDRSEAVRRAALARKRQEQAGTEPRRVFGAA